MNEWTIVLTLSALIGLFMTVGKPLLSLNKSITTLNINVEQMNKRLDKQEEEMKVQQEHARESHQKLWDKNDEQDEKLADHETRIKILEKAE